MSLQHTCRDLCGQQPGVVQFTLTAGTCVPAMMSVELNSGFFLTCNWLYRSIPSLGIGALLAALRLVRNLLVVDTNLISLQGARDSYVKLPDRALHFLVKQPKHSSLELTKCYTAGCRQHRCVVIPLHVLNCMYAGLTSRWYHRSHQILNYHIAQSYVLLSCRAGWLAFVARMTAMLVLRDSVSYFHCGQYALL